MGRALFSAILPLAVVLHLSDTRDVLRCWSHCLTATEGALGGVEAKKQVMGEVGERKPHGEGGVCLGRGR